MFSKGVLFLVLGAWAHHVHGDCIKSFASTGPRFTEVVLKEPGDWYSTGYKCNYQSAGSETLNRVDLLGPTEFKLCGGGLVPFGIIKNYGGYSNMHGDDVKIGNTVHLDSTKDVKLEDYESGYGVLNLSTGKVHFTDLNQTYKCVICQAKESATFDDIRYPLVEFDEYSYGKIFVITLVSNDKQAVAHNLSKESQANFERKIVTKIGEAMVADLVYETSAMNSDGFLEIKFRCRLNESYDDLLDVNQYQNVRLNAKYSMSVEDVSNCPQKSVTGTDGVVKTIDSDGLGITKTVFDASAWMLSQFTCKSDPQAGRRIWSTPIVWKVNHAPCSDLEQYSNNVEYKSIIGPEIEFNQKHQLQQYTSPPIDVSKFDEVARLTSREIGVVGEMTSEMHDDLRNILATLHTKGKVVNVQKPRVNFVVADLPAKTNAVNGFTLTFNETGKGEFVEPMQVGLNIRGRSNQSGTTVSLTVSSGLVEGADRLAFATFAKPRESYNPESLERYLEVEVVVVGDKAGKAVSAGYVDIYYDLSNAKEASNVSCRAITKDSWLEFGSYYGSESRDSDGCKHLEAKAEKQIVCRCDTKSFVDNNGFFSGIFKLKEKVAYYSNYYQSMNNLTEFDKPMPEDFSSFDYK